VGVMLRFAYYDNKLGLDHAVALAKEGHRVKYFHEWRFRYMRLEDYMVGRNLHENLQVVEDFFRAIHEGVDVAFIADVGYGYLGDYLRDVLGIPVFGASVLGDKLELYRVWAAEKMKEAGIKTPLYREVVGVDPLIDLGNRLGWDFFVKVNMIRGNMETQRVKSAKELKTIIESAGFGPLRDNVKFIVSEPIEGVELGVDAWFNGDEFVRPYHFGNEVKGTGCCFGKWVNESVWDPVLDRMEKILKGRYFGTISFEGIYDGSDIYVIDVTSRLAKPASSLQHLSVKGRYGDIVWCVARGKEVEVNPRGKYTVQLGFSFEEPESWVCLGEPRDDIVVCLYAFGLDGKIWLHTRDDLSSVVFYVDVGDDFSTLVSRAVSEGYKYAKEHGLLFSDVGVRAYKETIEKMKELGIDW